MKENCTGAREPLFQVPHPANLMNFSPDGFNVHLAIYVLGLQRHQDLNSRLYNTGYVFLPMATRLLCPMKSYRTV
ncbi:hypothetical protein TNCV_3450431 [Trichonephila clavipes]|uniref:Uncharacterized protein n=1 Tax=Trichonephila clavipes TaxID=2585209 RepID=A0A8X6WKC5_TRICX|nr:hypothetical protein TNCV_3450431 [Trichonephila clavipes]